MRTARSATKKRTPLPGIRGAAECRRRRGRGRNAKSRARAGHVGAGDHKQGIPLLASCAVRSARPGCAGAGDGSFPEADRAVKPPSEDRIPRQ